MTRRSYSKGDNAFILNDKPEFLYKFEKNSLTPKLTNFNADAVGSLAKIAGVSEEAIKELKSVNYAYWERAHGGYKRYEEGVRRNWTNLMINAFENLSPEVMRKALNVERVRGDMEVFLKRRRLLDE